MVSIYSYCSLYDMQQMCSFFLALFYTLTCNTTPSKEIWMFALFINLICKMLQASLWFKRCFCDRMSLKWFMSRQVLSCQTQPVKCEVENWG